MICHSLAGSGKDDAEAEKSTGDHSSWRKAFLDWQWFTDRLEWFYLTFDENADYLAECGKY